MYLLPWMYLYIRLAHRSSMKLNQFPRIHLHYMKNGLHALSTHCQGHHFAKKSFVNGYDVSFDISALCVPSSSTTHDVAAVVAFV